MFPCRSIYVIYVNHWLVLTEQDSVQCCLISSIFYLSKHIWINLVGSDYNTKHQQCSLNHLYTPQTIFPLCSCTCCKGIRLNLQQSVYYITFIGITALGIGELELKYFCKSNLSLSACPFSPSHLLHKLLF